MHARLIPIVALALASSSASPLREPIAEAGVIEGTLTLRAGPARRWASRYPGGGPMVGEVQEVPAVVYLTGTVLPAEGGGAAVDLAQRGARFAPGAVAVRTGTTLRFPNEDPFFHNVFSYANNARFDLGRYPSGQAREVRLDQPGIVRVYCEVHEFMRAVIVVTDHGFHAVVEDDGTFRIPGVPPGEYTLAAYHPDAGSVEQRVVVTDGDTVHLTLLLEG